MLAACDTVGRGHRRTRSIEGLGASMDASETFRAELERIGSSGLERRCKALRAACRAPGLGPEPSQRPIWWPPSLSPAAPLWEAPFSSLHGCPAMPSLI